MKNKEERFIYVTDGVSMFAHDRKMLLMADH